MSLILATTLFYELLFTEVYLGKYVLLAMTLAMRKEMN